MDGEIIEALVLIDGGGGGFGWTGPTEVVFEVGVGWVAGCGGVGGGESGAATEC